MKKVLGLAIFCLTVVFVDAQSYFGVMGGGSLTDEVEVRGALPVEWKKNDFWAFRFEPAFVIRGNREVNGKIKQASDYLDISLSYLECSFLAKLSLPWNAVAPYLTMGIQAGYGLSVQSRHIEDSKYFENRYKFKAIELNQLDGGLTFGFGIDKEISKNKKIFADFRYYLGIADIDSNGDEEIYNEGKVFSIGFLLPIRAH